MHVTVRLRDGLPNLRRRDVYEVLRKAFRLGCDRFGFRLAAYSVQHHHLHLVCEAPSAAALGHGMQGLGIRVAKGINHVRGMHGTIYRERYFARELRSLADTRNVLRYVSRNDRKHDSAQVDWAGRVDPCTSFYFWTDHRLFADETAPVVEACTSYLKAALRLELGLRGPPPAPRAAG